MNDGRLRELFERATELRGQERAQFLASACGDDRTLLQEVLELLSADSAAMEDEFWQHSALRNEVIAESHLTGSAVGEIVGNYRLVELVGSGGMGSVYRAVRVDAEFEMSVAVKLIKVSLFSKEVIANFRTERQILANLEHPNIARLLDGGARADGLPYLIMEYVKGVSPYDYCRQNNLSIEERLALFRQVCSAVHYAHQNMVIHRDLKPGNILVTEQGTPKLLDFGIAKVLDPFASQPGEALTEPGLHKMTVRYSSPEQVRGEPVTTASDVYSLGVILYELLTDHSPYGDTNKAAHLLMMAVCEEEPQKPSVWSRRLRGDLDNIVLKALQKAPLARYASVAQFSEDIGHAMEGRPVQARGDAPLYLAAKLMRRYRVILVAASLVLCSLIVGLVGVTMARARAERRFNELRQLAHSVMFDYADAIDRLPGSTPVRERLVKDALTYLDNLSKEADTPELQREIVDAYVRVSNVQGNEYQNNMGETSAALVSAAKAAAAAEKLLQKDRQPEALGSAAEAFSTHGALLYSTGDLHGADREYQRAIDLRREIAKQSPQDLENQLALCNALREMGDLSGGYGWPNLGKTDEALAHYQEAKAVVAKLLVQYPGNIDVAKESYKALLSLSSSEGAAGRFEDARKDLGDALMQIDKVDGAVPGDTNVKVELALAEGRLGQMLLDDRNAVAAIPHIARSAGLLEDLLHADPRNAIYRRGLSVEESQWSAALRGTGKFSEALTQNENALALAEALRHDAPDSVQYRSDVGVIERKLSEGLLAAGKAGEALRSARQAELILCENGPGPADAYTLVNCGRSKLVAGNAQLALNDAAGAVRDFREAEKIASVRSQAEPLNAIYRSDWARSEAGLAAGLEKAGDRAGAESMFEEALKNWAILRSGKSLTGEEAHRAEEAIRALSELRSRR